MRLSTIHKLEGRIELVTGLHIGSGDNEMHIGGTDNPVIKHPETLEPYIPGSSIKGKMRSLLEWKLGVVGITDGQPLGFKHIDKVPEKDRDRAKVIIKLFGGAPEGSGVDENLVKEIGPTRLSFWDCSLSRDWVEEMRQRNLLFTETKTENTIDRIRGVAKNPRHTERVPAGASFDFTLTIRMHEGDDQMSVVYEGLKLLEATGLGGSGSRGYGKIRFKELKLGNEDVLQELAKVNLDAD